MFTFSMKEFSVDFDNAIVNQQSLACFKMCCEKSKVKKLVSEIVTAFEDIFIIRQLSSYKNRLLSSYIK